MPSFKCITAAAVMQLAIALHPARAAAPLPVGSAADVRVEDTARGKTLDVRVTYPEGAGPFPLIVFSHGAGASKDDYQPLIRRWAAAGYVVLQMNHDDSGAATRESRYQAWSSRPVDLSALIDRLDEVEASVPQVRGKIDRSHVGAAGHSFGGQTAQMIGGFRMGGAASYRDDRVGAVVLLAPPGGGQSDSPRSWAEMRVPMLTIVGGADTGRSGESPGWRMDAYHNAPSRDDYLVVIDEAEHLLGGISETRGGKPIPRTPDQFALVAESTRLFWDAYLKGDAAACNGIGSGQIVAKSPVAARFESKSGIRLRSASAPDRVQFASASESFLMRYDVDGDGAMSRDEAPERLPSRAFDTFDRDGDGLLSQSEVEPMAERLAAKGNGRGGGRGGRTGAAPARAVEEMAPITQTTSSGTAVCHLD